MVKENVGLDYFKIPHISLIIVICPMSSLA